MTQTQTSSSPATTKSREVVLEVRGLDVDYGHGPDAVTA